MTRFWRPGALAWLAAHGAHADSVELKALLATPARDAARALAGRSGPEWRVRQMYLLDTAGLRLADAGVEIRLRRRGRGRHDLSVRTRRCDTMSPRPSPRSARVEYDVLPGVVWETVELRRNVDTGDALAVIAGASPPIELLSPAERTWARRGADEAVTELELDDLRLHGPLVVERLRVPTSRSNGLQARLEYCRYPSGRELVELSTRCRPDDAEATARALGRLVTDRGVAMAQRHRTKSSVWHDELAGRRAG